jgi:HEAT repeat protein
MPLFGPPNVSKLIEKRDINGLIKALLYKDPLARQEAAKALGEIGSTQAVAPLNKTIKEDNEEDVRSAAAEALGEIGDTRATEPLTDALTGSYKYDKAIYGALRKLGEPAFQALIQIISLPASDRTMYRKMGVCSEIGTFKDARAIPPLIKALEDGFEEAADGLRYLAFDHIKDKAAVKPLINASYSNINRMRKKAYEALGMIGDEEAVPRLIVAGLSESDPDCRQSALNALSLLSQDKTVTKAVRCIASRDWHGAVSLGKVSIEPLKFTISRGNASVWSVYRDHKNKILPWLTDAEFDGAISSLAEIGGAEVLEALFEIHKNWAYDFGVNDEKVFKAIRKVAEAMANARDMSALEPLFNMLVYDAEGGYKFAEREEIGSISSELFVDFGEPVLEKLALLLKIKNWKTRWNTMGALSRFESERARELLRMALNDEDEGIRRRAEEALKKYHARRGG